MADRPKLEPPADPLATNRGVSPTVSISIDWISFTFKDSKKLSYPQELTKEKVECKPLNGYNLGAKYSDGRIELIHTTRPEMGTHIIFGGSCLRSMPLEPLIVLRHIVGAGARCTRLDLAIDCYNTGLKPQQATEEITNERVSTLARKFPIWYDPTQKGYTQYIGKKSSSAFCRIYDKGAEMGVGGEWTRVECSFAGRRAMDAGKKCLQGTDFRALVRGFVDFSEWDEWNKIMSVTPVQTNAPRTLSNTKRWLLSSAAPSLARELYLDGDDAFYFQWLSHMRFCLDKLREQISYYEPDSKVS